MRASTDTLMKSESLPVTSFDDIVRLNCEGASQVCARYRLCFSWHAAAD